MLFSFSAIISIDLNAQSLEAFINKDKVFQTIEGFGASDAWRCEFVGENWPEEKKEKIAELLFSKELDANGNPKGIGLSLWRFYIGAGSTEQKADSGIHNEWRRAECFINKQGKYDWNKQKGQQWFLHKAKEYDVDRFLAFSISAPVQWTKNGKAYNGNNTDGEINLKPVHYEDYSDFMIKFLNHFKEEGILFDYLSPINEPQWDWDNASQEGTPATNENILKLISILNADIEKSNLSTKIVVAEAADLRWLYSDFGKSRRGNQIEYFFDKKHSFQNLKSTISGHSYFTTWPVDSLISIRKNLNRKLEEYNLDYWQSEFCILEKSDDIGGGNKRDLGIDTALYVARVIHADLTLANASSWQWWTAITRADFKDGLIYIDTGNERKQYDLEQLKFDGEFHDSKLLWAFGNYSRFVKPGMRRLEIILNDDKSILEQYSNVILSAYFNKITSEIVVVGINYSDEDKVLSFSDFVIENIYVTSKDRNLGNTTVNNNKVSLDARSISTLIGHLKI